MNEIIQNSKLNLLEYYPVHFIKNLVKVFPRLNGIIPKNIESNSQPIFIDKFLFYRMVLEKIKNYFEISESFVLSESIEIILKDIKSKTKVKKNENKIDLPKLTNRHNISNLNLNIPIDVISSRNNSTKDNRNKNINSQIFTPVRKYINQGSDYDTPSVNRIYLNLEKKGDSKKRLVHFIDYSYLDNNTANNNSNFKNSSKKSNLKPLNNRKQINLNLNNQFDTMINNTNIKKAKNNNKPLLKTNTEYSLINENIGIRKSESGEIKEKKIIVFSDRIKNIYEKNIKNMNNVDNKDFNIFEFENNVGKENTLLLIGKYIFNFFNLGEVVNQLKFDNWTEQIAKGYNRSNFYHHDLHAADVAHTSFIFLKYGNIIEIAKLDTSMICAIIMSCICHDYRHPGVNNNFLIDTNNEIALNYNDISALENMHISEAFKLMHSNPNYNVFEGLDRDKYKKFRRQMILCVLATDMANHNLSINFLNNCLSEKNKPEDNDKQEFMKLAIHAADISNPTKIFDIYFKWAKLIMEEFYSQGDKEKQLGLKCSYDRIKNNRYQIQIGFIEVVELPFFGLVTKVFPKLDYLIVNLNNNKQKLKKLDEEHKNGKNKSKNN